MLKVTLRVSRGSGARATIAATASGRRRGPARRGVTIAQLAFRRPATGDPGAAFRQGRDAVGHDRRREHEPIAAADGEFAILPHAFQHLSAKPEVDLGRRPVRIRLIGADGQVNRRRRVALTDGPLAHGDAGAQRSTSPEGRSADDRGHPHRIRASRPRGLDHLPLGGLYRIAVQATPIET